MRDNLANQNLADSALVDTANSGSSLIVIGVLLGLCMIGLTHGGTYLEQHEHGISVELGAGIEDQEDFEQDVNAAPSHRKLGFAGLLIIACYCYYTSSSITQLRFSMVTFLIGCCLFLVASSYFWSFGRDETARELIRIVAYAGVAYALAKRFRPRELLTVMMLMASTSVIAACLVDVAMGGRPWQPNYRLHGTLHSNLLAHQALVALLAAYSLYATSAKPWVWKSVFLAMLMVIVLTKTRGALASSLVGLVAITLVAQSFRSFLMFASLAGLIVTSFGLGVLLLGSEAQERLSNAATLGRSKGVSTLTGRIPLWEAVLKESKENRLKGYGYGAFWNSDRTKKLAKKLQWFPGHSHSAYIQTVLDIGYFGVALVLMLVLASLIQSGTLFLQTGEHAYRFAFGFIAAGLVDGLVEVSFVYPRELGLFVGITLFMLIVYHAPQKKVRSEAEPNECEASYLNGLKWRNAQPAF